MLTNPNPIANTTKRPITLIAKTEHISENLDTTNNVERRQKRTPQQLLHCIELFLIKNVVLLKERKIVLL